MPGGLARSVNIHERSERAANERMREKKPRLLSVVELVSRYGGIRTGWPYPLRYRIKRARLHFAATFTQILVSSRAALDFPSLRLGEFPPPDSSGQGGPDKVEPAVPGGLDRERAEA
jgi:hypothetical protein